MKTVEWNKVIPPAYTGVNTKTSSRIECTDETHADFLFNKAVHRLLDVNNWQHYSGNMGAEFSLTAHNGDKVDEPAGEGYNIRIDIPGFGNKTGRGSDWVVINAIEYYAKSPDEALVAMKVKPTKNPMRRAGRTAHFFKSYASSTFVVERNKLLLTCSVIGRNEHANIAPPNIFEKIRNFFTALFAWMFFSKLQWKLLTKGILSYSKKEQQMVK